MTSSLRFNEYSFLFHLRLRATCSAHLFLLRLNIIKRYNQAQITNFLIMQLSATFCHFLSLRSKCSKFPVINHPLSAYSSSKHNLQSKAEVPFATIRKFRRQNGNNGLSDCKCTRTSCLCVSSMHYICTPYSLGFH
jgi:hypothetical protein